jgi:hypothetical protein
MAGMLEWERLRGVLMVRGVGVDIDGDEEACGFWDFHILIPRMIVKGVVGGGAGR